MLKARDFMRKRAVDLAEIGRYSLASRYDAKGKRREFACRTRRISPFQMMVSAPVSGPTGERVLTYFGEFGHLDGFISDVVEGGFLLDLSLPQDRRERLAMKLEWLERRLRDPTVADCREQRRLVPDNPHTTLLFADASVMSCFAIDVSSSGAAVSADVEPDLGTRCAVGRTVGTVVRRFSEGFAVMFDNAQDEGRILEAIKPTMDLELAVKALSDQSTSQTTD